MVSDSRKKTEEEVELKRKCHQSRLAVKRGKHDHEHSLDSKLAQQYVDGSLQGLLVHAERDYSRKKRTCVAILLKALLAQ